MQKIGMLKMLKNGRFDLILEKGTALSEEKKIAGYVRDEESSIGILGKDRQKIRLYDKPGSVPGFFRP